MNLLQQTAIAAGITTTNSRERNEQLYPLVIAGNEEARREMIEGNMALVTLRVNTFIRFFPQAEFLRDDLISEGLLALVSAVNGMKNRIGQADCNPQGYLLKSISNALGEMLDSESHLQMLSKTVRNKRAEGETLPQQIPMSGSMPDVAFDEQPLRELKEDIWSVAETDEERTVLRMREEGFNDREIGEVLGMPNTTVWVTRRDLYERFLAASGMTGEA